MEGSRLDSLVEQNMMVSVRRFISFLKREELLQTVKEQIENKTQVTLFETVFLLELNQKVV